DHREVAARGERAVFEDVSDPAAHPRGEVAPGAAEDERHAAGHVLAAVIAAALDDRGGAAVPDAEALARASGEEGLPGGRAAEDRVADDDVLVGAEARASRRADREDASREALADVVVRVPLEDEEHPARRERAEALSGGASGLDRDRAVLQAVAAEAP